MSIADTDWLRLCLSMLPPADATSTLWVLIDTSDVTVQIQHKMYTLHKHTYIYIRRLYAYICCNCICVQVVFTSDPFIVYSWDSVCAVFARACTLDIMYIYMYNVCSIDYTTYAIRKRWYAYSRNRLCSYYGMHAAGIHGCALTFSIIWLHTVCFSSEIQWEFEWGVRYMTHTHATHHTHLWFTGNATGNKVHINQQQPAVAAAKILFSQTYSN